MNDFTKEELKELKKWLNHKYTYNFTLYKKIQSMIDNYEKDQKTKESLNYIVKKAREWIMEL